MRRALLGIASAIAALLLWAFAIELNRLVVTRAEFTVSGLPEGFDGIRVAAFSDLHAGARFIDEAKVRKVVAAVNALQPDMIVLLGDYVTGHRTMPPQMLPETVAANLRGLQAPLGVWAVLGNHDWWTEGPRIRRALESAGIQFLDGRATRIERGGDALWLAGVPDYWTQPRSEYASLTAAIPENAPVIAITHNPDLFPLLPERIGLLIAGHTHGGQVRIPFLGRPIVPSMYNARYAAGLVREGGRAVYVTTGIGTSIMAVRFLTPPEVVLLTLRKQAR